MEAFLFFQGAPFGYDQLPSELVAEIQSPNNVVGQKIIVVGLGGDISGRAPLFGSLSNASAQVGIGVAYNDGEKPGSYSNPFSGGCQKSFIIDTKTP